MTTLADINATLGATNIALSGVSKNQEETNQGLNSFLDYLKDKDADTARRDLEDRREAKASALKRGAAVAGRGLARVGRGALGGLGSLFSGLGNLIPTGIGAGLITGLVGSKLFRFGLPALGFLLGDELAEILVSPDSSKGFKDAVAGAIKGGSIGFLFGKKGFILGTALGALLTNDEVDKQLGNLKDNVADLSEKLFGLDKDSLAGALKAIADGVGDRLKNLNSVLKGKFDTDSVIGSLELLAGAAFLISPIGSAKLAFAATAALSRTPAGRALLALSAFGLIKEYVFSGGGEIKEAEEFATTSPEYNSRNENKEKGFFSPITEPLMKFYKKFEFFIDMALGYFAFYFGGKAISGIRNFLTRGPKPVPTTGGGGSGSVRPSGVKVDPKDVKSLSDEIDGKNKRNILKRFLGKSFRFLQNAGKFGIRFLKNGTPLVVPLTAADLLIPGEEERGLNQRIQEGAIKAFGVGGMRKGNLLNVYDPSMGAGFVDALGGANSTQQSNRLLSALNTYNNQANSPGALGGNTTVMNSGNTRTDVTNNQGLVVPRSKTNDASDPHALKTGAASGMGLF